MRFAMGMVDMNVSSTPDCVLINSAMELGRLLADVAVAVAAGPDEEATR